MAKTKIAGLIFSVLLLLFSAVSAYAIPFSFGNITNNLAGDAAIGEAQLSMDVTANGENILFLFSNSGPADSSITDIYFDDDVPLLQFSAFVYYSTGGVAYSVGAAPPDLPGGSLSFSADYAYDSDSGNPGVQANGINPGEQLGLLFDYCGVGFDQVIAALESGGLNVGIHVQGFESGGSESFTTNSPAPVPEPATVLLLGIGLISLTGIRRKQLKK